MALRQLLDLELDGVVISSPHVLHFEHAKAALERGFHVLVEKPVATRGHEARALVELARVQNKQIMIPQGWSFRPFAREARRLAPEIGEPRHFVCQMASALSDLFAGEPMLETAGATFRPPASTWADPEQAGGYGWGFHSFSLERVRAALSMWESEYTGWYTGGRAA